MTQKKQSKKKKKGALWGEKHSEKKAGPLGRTPSAYART